MSTADLNSLQHALDISFSHPETLSTALTHRSASHSHNERLEFLGDSLVNSLVAEFLYETYPESPEGELTAMRASLVCKETLAEIAREMKLGNYLVLGEGTSKTGGHRLDSILGDAYEALLGAVFLDAGWDKVRALVRKHFSDRILNISDMNQVRDAKSRLQEWLQAKREPLPEYQVIEVGGPGHAQHFQIRCVVPCLEGDFLGDGSSRRKAEQKAAEAALSAIEND